MYDKLAYALVPSGYKANKLYSFVGGDLTFTRTSTATRINKDGLIEFVETGVPRLNYPLVNGVPSSTPELLLEPARVNLLSYSEDLSNGAWDKTNVTIDSETTVAPDGNTTANIMRETTATSEHRINRSYSFDGGNAYYTYSVFAKHSGTRKFNLFSATQSRFAINATFDLIEGTASAVSGTATIEAYPNGWYRCIATGISASSGSANLYFRHRDASNNTTFDGDLNEVTELWGAQLEEGDYPTSYIPTFDSTASRNAETANNATAELNDAEGVLYVETARIEKGASDTIITINDGSGSNRIEFLYNGFNQNRIFTRIYNAGVEQVSFNTDLANAFDFNKIAIKYKSGDFAVWANGIELYATASTGTLPTGLDEIDFERGNSGGYFYGRARQVLYFNEALTDSELETLTT